MTERDSNDPIRDHEARLLLARLPALLWVVDPDLRFVSATGAALNTLGLESGRLRGMHLSEYFGTDDDNFEPLRAHYQALAGFAQTYSLDWAGRIFEAHVEPLYGEGGEIEGVIGLARDITDEERVRRELRAVEEQLLHAQKLESLGRLAGGVAHDFNNLLTVMLGHLDLLELEIGKDERLRDLLDQARLAGERAAALTARLLAFGRRQLIAPRLLDVSAALGTLEKLLMRLISENIRVTTSARATWTVRIDPGQFENVIVNLIVNAQDAMPEGGELNIESSDVTLLTPLAETPATVPPGEYVRVVIRDTGSGMSAEVLEHLFEPFYTTKAPGKGTGLGLSMCYGTIRQAGGYVGVSSHEGDGTTFRIYLPRVRERSEPARGLNDRTQALGGHETILVAEDDPLVSRLVQHVLSVHGYTVLCASSGPEAVNTAKVFAGAIALLVTDLVLPEYGGRELTRRIQASRPDIKVLYVSGYDPSGDNPTPFLQKPFVPSALVAAVRELLDSPERTPLTHT